MIQLDPIIPETVYSTSVPNQTGHCSLEGKGVRRSAARRGLRPVALVCARAAPIFCADGDAGFGILLLCFRVGVHVPRIIVA